LMVACHNFDLDAARGEGYQTAFVHRPAEWGPAGPPDPIPTQRPTLWSQDLPSLPGASRCDGG
jgi:2-haloacid dehalogenase